MIIHKSWFTVSSFVILVFSLLNACKQKDLGTEPVPENMIVGNWKFVAFETIGDTVINLDPLDSIFLFLYKNGELHGKSRGRCADYYDGYYRTGVNNGIKIDSTMKSHIKVQTNNGE